MRLHPSLHLDVTLPPIAWAALAQLLAAALTIALARIAALSGLTIGLQGALAIQGGLAAVISYALRLPAWWLPIQLVFVPLLVMASQWNVAPAWYLGAFMLLALLFWSTFRTQVPLYLSRPHVWRVIEGLVHPGQRFIDLGAGIGGLVAHLGLRCADSEIVGIECAPLPSLIGKLRTWRRPNARMVRGNFWQEDLSRYDVVFAYLSPVPMPALWEKAKREMRPGTRFVSYRFEVPGSAPSETIELDDWGRTRLYVWQM